MTCTDKPLLRRFLKFSSMAVLSLWVYHFYAIVDGIFVSRGVSEIALSAVNIAIPYTNVMFSVGILFAVGTSTVTAICLGGKEYKKANAVFTQSIVILSFIGIAMSAIVLINIERFSLILGANAETKALVCDYLRGIAPFSPFFMVSYCFEILIKTDGHPGKATAAVITGCLTNCVLDYLFIFVWEKGVYGAALATGISQLIVVLIYIYHFVFSKSTFKFVKFKTDLKTLKRIALIGLPDGITEICAGVSVFMYNRVLLSVLGNSGIISYSVVAYINTMVSMTMLGISQGMQPLVSFSLGKKEKRECSLLLKYASVAVCAVSVFSFALCNIFAEYIVAAFIKDVSSAVYISSLSAFRRFSLSFLVLGFNILIAGYLTAVEKPKKSFFISLGRGFVFQAAFLFLTAALFPPEYIFLTNTFSEITCLVLSLVLLKNTFKKNAPGE